MSTIDERTTDPDARAGVDARLHEGAYPFDDTRRLHLSRLDPSRDAALVHTWVSQDRARFWGMVDHAEEHVRETYAFVDALPTHHAYLVSVAERPVALLQTYQPAADPVGETYQVAAGDLGVHLLMAPAKTHEPGFTRTLSVALARVIFAAEHVQRVVVEPDTRNEAALDRLRCTGFELGPEVDLPGKRARLAFLQREVVQTLLRW